jgi:tetratricopeptide (TPR) repeat protein
MPVNGPADAAAAPRSVATAAAAYIPLEATAEGSLDGSGVGTDAEAMLTRANEAYAAGDFETAIAEYQALLRGRAHALLHYNLGNAYLRQGDLGRAIASYRRARVGAPRNQDVAANLAFARRSGRDAIAPPEPTAVWKTVFAWYYAVAPSELWVATAVFNAVLWSLLALRLWRRHEILGWATAVAGLLLLLCAGALLYGGLAADRVAVIVPREVDVRSGIREDTVVRFKLHAGSEVRVRDEREGWLRVVLPSGEQGWIEAADAEVVEP